MFNREVTARKKCPICSCNNHKLFLKELVDQKKINEFSFASRKEPEFMRLKLLQCLGCDLIYTPTPLSHSYLSKVYSNASFDSNNEAVFASKSYFEALKKHIINMPHLHDYLDVGTGNGSLLPFMKTLGFVKTMGIEPSVAAINSAPPELRPYIREGMFTRETVSDLNLSVISSFMTLEHLDNPQKFINDTFELLQPGGKIAIVVHNWRASINKILGEKSPIIDIEHQQLFSHKAIQFSLHQAGFENIQISVLKNKYPLSYWLKIAPVPHKLKSKIFIILKKMNLDNLPIALKVGNILAVAQKPFDKL